MQQLERRALENAKAKTSYCGYIITFSFVKSSGSRQEFKFTSIYSAFVHIATKLSLLSQFFRGQAEIEPKHIIKNHSAYSFQADRKPEKL